MCWNLSGIAFWRFEPISMADLPGTLTNVLKFLLKRPKSLGVPENFGQESFWSLAISDLFGVDQPSSTGEVLDFDSPNPLVFDTTAESFISSSIISSTSRSSRVKFPATENFSSP